MRHKSSQIKKKTAQDSKMSQKVESEAKGENRGRMGPPPIALTLTC